MAIFITGDVHGDFRRLNEELFSEKPELSKGDYMIICGDFGGVWNGSPEEQRRLDWLEARPYTTLFVSGNHENFELLEQLPAEDWHGGKVQRVRPSVIHLMRGQVYNIEGKAFFTMGGARSQDISGGILEPDDPQLRNKQELLKRNGGLYRINHLSWWTQELPSEEEYQTARASLEAYNWAVDYIITHCCPTPIHAELTGGAFQADPLTDFFEEIAQKCQFEYWFFGHYHDNGVIEKKYILLYDEIVQLIL